MENSKTKYPVGMNLAQGMSSNRVKINGMRILLEEKVGLMPIKTTRIINK